MEDYQYQLEKYVIPKIGRVQLDKLNPMHIQTMCGELADAISPQRANKCRRILSTALTQAVRWQLIPRNYCDAVQPMKVDKDEIIVWNPDEASRFLDTARGHRFYSLFYLAMSTGMRRGELLGLRWQDIGNYDLYIRQSLIEQRGRIMFSTTKTKKGQRRIDISQDVRDVLEEHRKQQEAERQAVGLAWPGNDLVFTTGVGTPMHPRNLMRIWYSLQEKAREKWRSELEETLEPPLRSGAGEAREG